MKKIIFTLIFAVVFSSMIFPVNAAQASGQNSATVFLNKSGNSSTRIDRKKKRKLKKKVRQVGRVYKLVKPDKQDKKKARKVERKIRRIINIW